MACASCEETTNLWPSSKGRRQTESAFGNRSTQLYITPCLWHWYHLHILFKKPCLYYYVFKYLHFIRVQGCLLKLSSDTYGLWMKTWSRGPTRVKHSNLNIFKLVPTKEDSLAIYRSVRIFPNIDGLLTLQIKDVCIIWISLFECFQPCSIIKHVNKWLHVFIMKHEEGQVLKSYRNSFGQMDRIKMPNDLF